jgi:DNA topoisomerase IA
MGVDRLPEIARVVMVDPVDIDQIGVAARLVADDAALLVAGDIDSEGEAVADHLARG